MKIQKQEDEKKTDDKNRGRARTMIREKQPEFLNYCSESLREGRRVLSGSSSKLRMIENNVKAAARDGDNP